MTNITTLERVLQAKAEELLEKKGYEKIFYSEGIGGMWERDNTVVDITVHAGHHNAVIVIDPYIVIRVNEEPHIIHAEKEIKELFENF